VREGSGDEMKLLILGAVSLTAFIVGFIKLWLYIGRLYDEGRRPGK